MKTAARAKLLPLVQKIPPYPNIKRTTQLGYHLKIKIHQRATLNFHIIISFTQVFCFAIVYFDKI